MTLQQVPSICNLNDRRILLFFMLMPTPTTPQEKKYNIRRSRVLSSNNASTTYLGSKISTGENFAFKLYNLSGLPLPLQKQHQREIDILQKLSKLPSTPRIRDVIQRGPEVCLVMDVINSKPISSLLNKYPNGIPDRIAIPLFKTILSAINDIHHERVCHLALSLDNLVFDSFAKGIKVIDFTKARETSTNVNGKFIPIVQRDFTGGAPSYAAPETLKELPYDGIKADIWSLGVIFYVLLCNTFPFGGTSTCTDTIIQNIKRGNLSFPPTISKSARSLIQSMLQSEPSMRPHAVSLLRHPYLDIL